MQQNALLSLKVVRVYYQNKAIHTNDLGMKHVICVVNFGSRARNMLQSVLEYGAYILIENKSRFHMSQATFTMPVLKFQCI